MVAVDPLPEGLCRQLSVVMYHSDFQTQDNSDNEDSANVHVKLVESLRLLPHQSALIRVELKDNQDLGGLILLESNLELVEVEEIQLMVSHRKEVCSGHVFKPNPLFPITEVWNLGRWGNWSKLG